MKANEAPEKIYFSQIEDGRQYFTPAIPFEREFVEYMPVDVFIEKACEFLKSYRQDTPDGFGYIAGIVNDKTIEDFRKYIKGE